MVSKINSMFSSLTYQPVVFLHTQDLTFSQYLALLTVGDAFIVTSLREGMALRTHEYVECQEGKYRPLILSEVGSFRFLFWKKGADDVFSLRGVIVIVDLDRVLLSTLGIPAGRLGLFIRYAFSSLSLDTHSS